MEKVVLHSVPEPNKDGDAAVLWSAESPTAESARSGLVVLGDDSQFGSITTSVAQPLPRRVSVEITTSTDRFYSDSYRFSDGVPNYPAGTAAEKMSFDVAIDLENTKVMTHGELRAEFVGRLKDCA